jgi:hypothetical protein
VRVRRTDLGGNNAKATLTVTESGRLDLAYDYGLAFTSQVDGQFQTEGEALAWLKEHDGNLEEEGGETSGESETDTEGE